MSMMDTPASSYVLTKLRIPAIQTRQIQRQQLVDLLSEEKGSGFILVSAPAGYGKTTLLAAWAHSLVRNGCTVAWYAIDSSDDAAGPFGSYLVAALIQVFGPSPELERTAKLLRSSPEVDLQSILPVVINTVATSKRKCVLILDDYHLITSPAIHSAMAFLLDHLPENMRIAMGSRSDPPLPLARLRVRGKMLEMRTAGLRFTPDETARFLIDVMQLDLSPELVAALETRTEGWAAGLQLAALSLVGREDRAVFIKSFSGSHRHLVEYLLDEVINRQPEQIREFLLRTSILERMCAPICDDILGETYDSETILEGLESANLFVVSLDFQGYWYRYHRLFRDFLKHRLQKTHPEEVKALHHAACEWLSAHDFTREAAGHALQTQDWEYAAAFVEKHSFNMILHSEISTLSEWCSVFPEDVMQAHPMLCILQSWAWVFSFSRKNRSRVEARLTQAEQAIALLDDRKLAQGLNEHAAIVRTFLSMAPDPTADARKQLVLVDQLLAVYPEDDPGRFSALLAASYAHMALQDAAAASKVLGTARQIALRERLFFGIVESTFHLARLAHSQGQLRLAVELCRQAQAELAGMLEHPERALPALGCLDIATGCVQLEQDQLEDAERNLLRGLDLIGLRMNPYYLLTALVALARLREIQGRLKEALEYITLLEDTWPDVAFCTGALRMMITLRSSGDPKSIPEAASWSESFSTSLEGHIHSPGIGPFGAAEAYYLAHLAWIRTQIANGKAPAALPALQHTLELASANGLASRVIELSLLEAQAGHAVGDQQRTWKALERALVNAQPGGFIRIFDQGAAVNGLLVEAARRGICPEYTQRVLASILPAESTGSELQGLRTIKIPAHGMVENLSERELDVLHLMALGASNQEIAEQLVITVGTVKSHINHILRKVDAHNRTEAVARVRALGLVDL
jgi:LuxR family transcriptional regulator, maltose regulon positive regulatory protein